MYRPFLPYKVHSKREKKRKECTRFFSFLFYCVLCMVETDGTFAHRVHRVLCTLFLSSLKIRLQLWACIVPPSAKALIKPHQSCITLFSTPPRSGTDQFGSNCQDEVKLTKVIQDHRNSPADSMTLTLLTSSLSTPPAVRPTVNYTCSGIGH